MRAAIQEAPFAGRRVYASPGYRLRRKTERRGQGTRRGEFAHGSRQPAARPGLAAPPTQDSVTGMARSTPPPPTAPAHRLPPSSIRPLLRRSHGRHACAAPWSGEFWRAPPRRRPARGARQERAAVRRRRYPQARTRGGVRQSYGDSSLQSLGVNAGLDRGGTPAHAPRRCGGSACGVRAEPHGCGRTGRPDHGGASHRGRHARSSGSYYRTGDTLFLQAAVTDVGNPRPVSS